MKKYKIETLKQKCGSRLNGLDDAKLARLYGSQTYCARWMMTNERGLSRLVDWAITAPL